MATIKFLQLVVGQFALQLFFIVVNIIVVEDAFQVKALLLAILVLWLEFLEQLSLVVFK